MDIYERNINSVVKKIDEKTILTKASLLDLNHSIQVSLTIDIATREIKDATATILKAPLKVCDSTLDLVQNLKGIKIERGINRKLIQVLGGADGCTHLYELALNAVRLSFNVLIGMKINWSEWVDKTLDDETFTQMARPHLEDSCRPFKKPE